MSKFRERWNRVKARKEHVCTGCGKIILKGQEYYSKGIHCYDIRESLDLDWFTSKIGYYDAITLKACSEECLEVLCKLRKPEQVKKRMIELKYNALRKTLQKIKNGEVDEWIKKQVNKWYDEYLVGDSKFKEQLKEVDIE
jgi:hypothetical protein